MIKKPILITYNLEEQQSFQPIRAVIHIDDTNTEVIELALFQGGAHIAVPDSATVTARFVTVKDNFLINDSVACEVMPSGNVYIPIDNSAGQIRTGDIKIEVNIVDSENILTTQFPLLIRVNDTILDNAEVTPESEGTVPELLKAAKEMSKEAAEQLERVSGFHDGEDGKSAYEIAVDNGFVGTEQEWLNSLKGADGNDGAKGAKGDKGDPGDDYILTDQDKTDIAEIVLSELPNADTMSF